MTKSVKGLGDPNFDGLGEYVRQSFTVPPQSHRGANGYLTDDFPGPAAASNLAAPAAAMGVDRYAGRF